ncbi:MAG TPA: HIT domain-containing protein [Ignavibacteria bacterium]|nr:HIT domain-containing protein [Ignavibacteria bacterium]
MTDPNCIFCKIVKGEIPSFKIYEDNDFIAILDLFPNTQGMALVLTKEHFDSYAAEMDDKIYSEFFLTAKKISKLMDEKLSVRRTALVMEGMGINHAHIKLYPLHGLDSGFKEILSEESVYFKEYQGYITTQPGPKASVEELTRLRDLFK